MVENAKIEQLNWDILSYFQTLCYIKKVVYQSICFHYASNFGILYGVVTRILKIKLIQHHLDKTHCTKTPFCVQKIYYSEIFHPKWFEIQNISKAVEAFKNEMGEVSGTDQIRNTYRYAHSCSKSPKSLIICILTSKTRFEIKNILETLQILLISFQLLRILFWILNFFLILFNCT